MPSTFNSGFGMPEDTNVYMWVLLIGLLPNPRYVPICERLRLEMQVIPCTSTTIEGKA